METKRSAIGTLAGSLGAVMLLTQPALAINVGGSVSAGGVSGKAGVSAGGGGISARGSVSAGSGRASVGGRVSAGGGRVSAGGSVSAGGGRVSASGGVSAGRGGISAGGSVSAGSGRVAAGASTKTGTAAASGRTSGARTAAATAGSTAPASSTTGRRGATASATHGATIASATAQPSALNSAAEAHASSGAWNFSLPQNLLPQLVCTTRTAGCASDRPDTTTIAARTPRYNQAQQALASIDAAPVAMVTACRNGIVEAAIPHGAVRVDAVSAGNIQNSADGQIAPLVVRIVYDRQGGYEIREAKVNCALDSAGAVTAVT